MEGIGSRLGYHVDYVARAPSILSCKRVVLDFEFLNGVHVGNKDDPEPLSIGIPRAVEQEASGSKEAAGEVHERDVLIRGVGDAAAAATELLRFRRVLYGRVEGGQAVDVAHIQRHLNDLLSVNVCRHVCVFCVQQGDIGGHSDRCGLAADRQSHVLHAGFGNFEDDSCLLIRLEALCFNRQGIGGWRKLIERVPASVVRRVGASDALF